MEAGGVGYDVTIPVPPSRSCPTRAPKCGCGSTPTSARTRWRLYGFLTQDEKALFEKLISVSGIGPTLAVKVLSGLAAADLILVHPARGGGAAGAIPGVGKKTAERMVLELRDKLPAPAGGGAGDAAGGSALARSTRTCFRRC